MLRDESLTQKFLTKGSWIYLFTFLGAPMLYLTRIALSQTLTVAEVGVMYSLVSLISIVAVLSDLGLKETMSYYLPRFRIEEKHDDFGQLTRRALSIKIGLTSILTIIGYYLAPFLAESYIGSLEYIKIIYLFLTYFRCFSIIQSLWGFFQSLQLVKYHHFTDFIRKAGIALISIFLWVFGLASLTSFTYAWMGGAMLSLFVAVYFFAKHLPRQSHHILGHLQHIPIQRKSFLRFGIRATLGTNALNLLNQVDQQMVLFFLGRTDAGIYANYISLLLLLTFLFGPLMGFIFSLVSEISSKQQRDKLHRLLSVLYSYGFLVGVAISSLMLVLGSNLAVFLYGAAYLPSGILLQWFALFGIAKILFMLNFAVLLGIGQSQTRTKVVMSVLLINIIFNLILIPLYGIRGAGLATAVSWVIMAVLSGYFLHQQHPFHINLVFIGKNTVSILIIAGLIAALTQYIQMQNIHATTITYRFIIGLAICILYGGVIYFNKNVRFGTFKDLLRK